MEISTTILIPMCEAYMSYINATDFLPDKLIQEIQNYIQGTQIYIPMKGKQRVGWGEKNGTKEKLRKRNLQIKKLKNAGVSIIDLAEMHHLSCDSIKKIVY